MNSWLDKALQERGLPMGGYCDIITDDDDSEFWCAYISQSKFIANGIAQHLAAYRKYPSNPFHYYYVEK